MWILSRSGVESIAGCVLGFFQAGRNQMELLIGFIVLPLAVFGVVYLIVMALAAKDQTDRSWD
jgi:hypothetical protein